MLISLDFKVFLDLNNLYQDKVLMKERCCNNFFKIDKRAIFLIFLTDIFLLSAFFAKAVAFFALYSSSEQSQLEFFQGHFSSDNIGQASEA